MARELGGARLLIIGTYRDMELSRQHPLAEALGELTRDGLFQRVLLRGLSLEDVGRFIEMTSGNSPPRGLVEAVHTQTEGNPLFVTEVVRLLVQEGELGAEQVRETDSWTIRIPEGVREVIGRRLNRLSQRCNEALTVASLLGREFTMSQLRPLVEEVTEDRLFEILEEALAARVIEELPQSVGRYQFTHALIQETLAAELSLTRRVRLHARIAETLEDLYGDDAESHAAELAHHFAQAQTLTGPGKVVRYSLLAGERALASYAHEDALACFQRALAAKEGSAMKPELADAETAAILFGLGQAQAALNQVQEAVPNLTRAFDYYADSEDVSRAIAIAQNPHSTQLISGMHEAISRAIHLVPPDSLQAGHILANHGYCLGLTSNGYEAAQVAFDQAQSIAGRHSDVALEMRVLANSGNIDGFHMRWDGSLAKCLQALELAPRVDDLHTEMRAHLWALQPLLNAVGDLEGARFHTAEMLAAAERLRDGLWLPRSLSFQIGLRCLIGDWQAARDLSDQSLGRFPQNRFLLGQRALFEYQLGDYAQGGAYLKLLVDAEAIVRSIEGLRADTGPNAARIAQIARITGVADRFDVVEAAAQAVISSAVPLPFSIFEARCGLALMAVHLGDVDLAGEQYAALVAQRRTFVARVDLAVDRMLGLLAQTMGNLDQAAGHFEDSLAFCRRAGYRPELAWTCCDYADALREREGEGDRDKIITLLDESLAISSELGMRPLMERVLSRREILSA